jgi:hypothetical protein
VRTLGNALVLVAAITAVGGIANARHGNDDKVVIDRLRYEKAVSQLLKDIEELDDRNENNPKKEDRKWIRERLDAMKQDLTGIRSDLQAAPPAGMPPPPPPMYTPLPPPPPAEPMAMSPQQFSDFIGELKKQSFDRERLGLLKEVAGQNWFTTDQVIQSMALFSFNSEKIAAGTAMYPRVVDRSNWYKVYSTFTFSSDQEKLRKQTSGK